MWHTDKIHYILWLRVSRIRLRATECIYHAHRNQSDPVSWQARCLFLCPEMISFAVVVTCKLLIRLLLIWQHKVFRFPLQVKQHLEGASPLRRPSL